MFHKNAVTSAKIHNGTIKIAVLGTSARGAKVIPYTANGSGLPGTVNVRLPGRWDATKLANSSWAVELVRNGPPSYLFPLGQAAPSGEGTSDGSYITVDGPASTTVHIAGPSFGSIDTIRIYQVSFKAFLVPDAVAPGASVDVICGLADLNTIGPNTRVYTADSATYSKGFPTLMSGADTVRIRKGAVPGIVCTTSTSTDFTLFKTITVSFTPVNSRTVRTAKPATNPLAAKTSRLFANCTAEAASPFTNPTLRCVAPAGFAALITPPAGANTRSPWKPSSPLRPADPICQKRSDYGGAGYDVGADLVPQGQEECPFGERLRLSALSGLTA